MCYIPLVGSITDGILKLTGYVDMLMEVLAVQGDPFSA